MESDPELDLADLLQAVARGERDALNAIFPLVYAELSALAHRQRQHWDGDLTLNTTALVHEAFLKFSANKNVSATSREHFFALAARTMRHVLCNYARDRQRDKRGGGAVHLPLEDVEATLMIDLPARDVALLEALDEAMTRLEQIAERASRVVECRFFGGMTVEETAAALSMSERTVKRDWNFARAWLRRELDHSVTSDHATDA